MAEKSAWAQAAVLVDARYPLLVELRHHLHQWPELGREEKETAAFVRRHLEQWGIPHRTVGTNHVIATVTGTGSSDGAAARTLALRGDMDALPITEETGVPWASRCPGIMHACGHDCHTTFMLGAALILHELRGAFCGTVRIIFQGNEEVGPGARELVGTDVLDGVDEIVALHVTMEKDLGTFSFNSGVMSAFSIMSEMTVDAPDANALSVAAHIISGITAQAVRRFPPEAQAVLVPTVLKAGKRDGGIPRTAALTYNARAFDDRMRALIAEILDAVPAAVAPLYGARVRVCTEGITSGAVIDNDARCTARARRVIEREFGSGAVCLSRPVMSSEDFSEFQRVVPGFYAHIGGVTDGTYHALHTSRMLPDDRILALGVRFLLGYAEDFFAEGKAAGAPGRA